LRERERERKRERERERERENTFRMVKIISLNCVVEVMKGMDELVPLALPT
jgi:hypothetical protein